MIKGIGLGQSLLNNYSKVTGALGAGGNQRRSMSPQDIIKQADENSDGKLDAKELKTITDKLAEMSGQTVNAEDLVTQYDEDQDGLLSEAEALAALDATAKTLGLRPPAPPPGGGMMRPPSLEDIISDADEDEDGALSLEELKAITEKLSEITGQAVNAEDLLAEYDEDGDGVLSASEALKALQETGEKLGLPKPGEMPPPPPDGATDESSTTPAIDWASLLIQKYAANATADSATSSLEVKA